MGLKSENEKITAAAASCTFPVPDTGLSKMDSEVLITMSLNAHTERHTHSLIHSFIHSCTLIALIQSEIRVYQITSNTSVCFFSLLSGQAGWITVQTACLVPTFLPPSLH